MMYKLIFLTDVKKMPLGVLSKLQIAKGFDVLEELQNALDLGLPLTKLQELSSKFYTVIPHSFGRKLPPTINSAEVLQKKKDMLLVGCLTINSVLCILCTSSSTTKPVQSTFFFFVFFNSAVLPDIFFV